MKFALAIETSEGVEAKTNLIVDLSNELAEFFSDKDYGNDVKQIVIGVISVAPEFEWFSKIRKPKYTFYRGYTRDGIEFVEDRVFSFDLKINYESLKNHSEEENREMLAREILGSLSNLESLPKKVRDFDKRRFSEDMNAFFGE